jgi:hypothetical protein
MKPLEPVYYSLGSRKDVRLRVFGPAQAARKLDESSWPPACVMCGKLDDLAYLDAGCTRLLDPNQVRLDFGYSQDGQLLVSTRVRDVLDAIPGADFERYPVGELVEPSPWVLHPREQIVPPQQLPQRKSGQFRFPAHSPFLAHGEPCSECRRYREVTFGFEWAPIPDDTVLAGISLEGSFGPRRWQWIGAQPVAEALREAGIAALHLLPITTRRV